MLVELTNVSPLALAPVLISILTLFGKKKKEEKAEEPKQPKTAEPAKPLTNTGHGGVGNGTEGPPSEIEDTSLNKILQMLMQDIPVAQPGEKEEGRQVSRTTPDWVPHRITPPSRPMVILPSEKGKKPDEELVQTKAPPAPLQAEAHPETSANTVVESHAFSSFPKLAGLEEEMKKLEEEVKKKLETPEKALKPEKTVVAAKELKQEKREPERSPSRKPAIGSERIFELTRGALRSPGLVLVSGPQGSGKTTVCSTLTAEYLQQGEPCLLVTYDQSATDAREAVRKLGCDVSNYESQFRFLLIDAFSAQTESFSMEPYYVEKPFDLASLQETLVRNVQIFMGERVTVILDSIDGLLSKVPPKEFVKGFHEMAEKLKKSGAILLATADSAKLSKDFEGPLSEMADCSIELEKSGAKGGRIKLRKAGGSDVRSEAEPFEFDQAKGLVFV